MRMPSVPDWPLRLVPPERKVTGTPVCDHCAHLSGIAGGDHHLWREEIVARVVRSSQAIRGSGSQGQTGRSEARHQVLVDGGEG